MSICELINLRLGSVLGLKEREQELRFIAGRFARQVERQINDQSMVTTH